jgi:hypothetical protein
VHGVGEIVANEDRHPDVGLARAQSLGMVVLCPKRLIDSSLLVALLRSPESPARSRWHGLRAGARGGT